MLFGKKKPPISKVTVKKAPSVVVINETMKRENPPGIPSRPYAHTWEVKINGVTFPCALDPKKSRQDVISRMREKDILVIKQIIFRDKPAYQVIDKRTGLDIGILPPFIIEECPDKELEGFVREAASFVPKDKEDKAEVWFCKARIYVLKDK